MNLSARQQREIEFFRRDAEQGAVLAEQPLNLEPAIGPKSWRTRAHPYVNAYWVILRKAKERSAPALWDRIGKLLSAFSPQECENYFRHAGYA